MWANPQITEDLLTFNNQTFTENFIFSSSESSIIDALFSHLIPGQIKPRSYVFYQD